MSFFPQSATTMCCSRLSAGRTAASSTSRGSVRDQKDLASGSRDFFQRNFLRHIEGIAISLDNLQIVLRAMK